MKARILSLSAIFVIAIAGLTLAQTTGEVTLTVKKTDSYGAFVADAEGRALYLFTADQQGQGTAKAESSCYDDCAKAWPPLLVKGEPQIGKKLKQELVGTIQRKDGSAQVTYGGWPLYYFVKDQGGESVTGQDVHGFSGEWYLVSPDGTKNEEEE